MGSKFYAINESGRKVPRDSNDFLGVVPMITATYLPINDMSWEDISRVSRRVSRSRGCYIPRLGERKSFDLTDGSRVKAKLVGLSEGNKVGFVFQITDGLDPSEFNNFMNSNVFELLPDDLKSVIVGTDRGLSWLPSLNNIFGPDIDNWYDWYEYHNSPDSRVVTDSSGNPSSYWIVNPQDNRHYLVDASGKYSAVDSLTENCVPSICFMVG